MCMTYIEYKEVIIKRTGKKADNDANIFEVFELANTIDERNIIP